MILRSYVDPITVKREVGAQVSVTVVDKSRVIALAAPSPYEELPGERRLREEANREGQCANPGDSECISHQMYNARPEIDDAGAGGDVVADAHDILVGCSVQRE